jgi:hypothetical protein
MLSIGLIAQLRGRKQTVVVQMDMALVSSLKCMPPHHADRNSGAERCCGDGKEREDVSSFFLLKLVSLLRAANACGLEAQLAYSYLTWRTSTWKQFCVSRVRS